MTTSFQVGSFYTASTTYWKYDRRVLFKCCRRTDKSVWLQQIESECISLKLAKIHPWHDDDGSLQSERATHNQWSIYSYRLATDADFLAANLRPPHISHGI